MSDSLEWIWEQDPEVPKLRAQVAEGDARARLYEKIRKLREVWGHEPDMFNLATPVNDVLEAYNRLESLEASKDVFH